MVGLSVANSFPHASIAVYISKVEHQIARLIDRTPLGSQSDCKIVKYAVLSMLGYGNIV